MVDAAADAVEAAMDDALEDAVDDMAEPVMKVLTAPAAPSILTLPKNTPITLTVNEEINTSTHREGDVFNLTVLNDVKVDGTTVIPRGTPATAEVTWRTGKGAFGKSGKMEFALQSIDLDGKQIPVTGEYRQEGEGNTVATGVGVLAVGVFAGFITGKRARLPAGRELMAQVAQPVAFNSDGSLASSFDSESAMAQAAANTDIGRCKAEAAKVEKESKREKALKACYVKRME